MKMTGYYESFEVVEISGGKLAPWVCAAAIAAVPLFHYTEGRGWIAQGLALIAVISAGTILLHRFRPIHAAMVALLALVGFWGLSVVAHPEMWLSYQSLVKMCVLSLAAHMVFRTRQHVLLLLGFVGATGLVLVAMNWGELSQLRTSLVGSAGEVFDQERFAGTFANANVAGIHGVMVLVAAFIIFFNSRHWVRWVVLVSGLTGGLVLCYYSGSRKAMLGLALMPLILPWLGQSRDRAGGIRWAKWLLLGAGAVLVAAGLLVNTPYLARLVRPLSDGPQVEASSSVRMAMLTRAVELWSEHPLLGCGFGGFARLSGFGVYSHTTFGEVLCNGGLVGLTLVLVFFLVPATQLAAMVQRPEGECDARLSAGLLSFWGMFTLFSIFAVTLDPGEYLPICAGVCGYIQEAKGRMWRGFR
jgi:hypothetical protein